MRYRFASCVLDTDRHVLFRDDVPVAVEPQVFDLLQLLVETPDRLLTRDEIVGRVWQGRIVSESAISARIASARKAVGDDGKRQAVIQTVSRRGLKLAVTVTVEGAAPSAAPAPAASPPPRIRYTTTPNGREVAWSLSGSGPPVVIASYIATDLEADWTLPTERALFEAIGAQNTLLRYDPSGTGQSGRGMPQLDYDLQADELKAAADAAGLERFALLARSGAALTAIHFAARYPERVSRMLIVGGYAEGWERRALTGDAGSAAMMQLVTEGWRNPEGAFGSTFLLAYLPEGPIEAVEGLARVMREAVDPEAEMALRHLQHTSSVLHLLPRIACPTLILHARRDRIHPVSEARKLAAGIPDAELITFDTANHMPLLGHPLWQAHLDATLEFLGRPG
ncbi:hypothetical protein ATO6_16185 [Oceanicola sp. 22II-s10i]|uniref:alpha/beta fold hydrolase n=1 Tax=Oceanicola sp. 22II-s10i TaxID=1317116 RepID=UPI000B5229ED|nr:alpha/beta fold hydrolase [Oceanicola sp. 22II-s10i]OWU83945.1 hypothetical protein ATO6_16185 [Oceanicola sp. 22II-s10i]